MDTELELRHTIGLLQFEVGALREGETKLQHALALAQAENRKVWVQIGEAESEIACLQEQIEFS